MQIHVLDCAAMDEAGFRKALAGHEVVLHSDCTSVPAGAEILSLFLDSHIGSEFLAEHSNLRLIATRTTTYDHIDLRACRRRGITVSYVPSYGDYTLAEHTFALLLAIARRLRPALETSQKTFSYDVLRGFQLHGKTIGIIGTGRIGLHVIRLARAFGMRTIAYDIVPRPPLMEEYGFEYVPFNRLLSESEVISLHATLTPWSYHMLNKDAFSKCRKGVVIINTARGALIKSAALLEALEDGIVSGAGLDVLEDERVMRSQSAGIISQQIIERLHSEKRQPEARTQRYRRIHELADLVHNEALLAHPSVVFTPHIGFNSNEAVERINETTVDNILSFIAGRPINVLCAPEPSSQQPKKAPGPEADSEELSVQESSKNAL